MRSHPSAGLMLNTFRSVRDVGQDSKRTFLEIHNHPKDGAAESFSLLSTNEISPADVYDISTSGDTSVALRSTTTSTAVTTTIDIVYNKPQRVTSGMLLNGCA